VHKRTYCVAVVVAGQWQTVAVPEQLAKQLQGYFQQPICTVLMKRDFQDLFYTGNLSQLGLNVVVNAAGVETSVHNRVKTDKRDA